MVIYEDKKIKFEIISENEIYENSNEYKQAKQFDLARTINNIQPVRSFFNNTYYYLYLESMYHAYETHEILKKDAFKKVVEANSIPVTIKVTNLKTGKSKTFNEMRYSDHLIKTAKCFDDLAWLTNKLANYNPTININSKDCKDKSQDFYKQLLLQTLRLNQRALANQEKNEYLVRKTENFIKFLSDSINFENIDIYGSKHTQVKTLPVLTDAEYRAIQEFSIQCENAITYNSQIF